MSYVTFKLIHLLGLVALPYRNQAFARSLLFLLPLLAILGAFLANHKPF